MSLAQEDKIILEPDGENVNPSPGPAPVAPILDKEHRQVCKEEKETVCGGSRLVLRKCSCGSPWCPTCRRKLTAPVITARLTKLRWQSTRQVVLTIDPKHFSDPSGQEAFEHVRKKNLIPQLIHNLKRTKGVEVYGYHWVLEFHRNGFPHWHVFIDVNIQGKAGMIGGDVIRQYWTIGGVREMPIKNERHWNQLTAYVGKTGYFEKKKGYQAELPQWAKDRFKKIRKHGGTLLKKKTKVIDLSAERTKRLKAVKAQLKKEIQSQARVQVIWERSYQAILDQCGQNTEVVCFDKTGRFEVAYRLPIPYRLMTETYKNIGQYSQGVGFNLNFDDKGYDLFFKLYGHILEIR